MKNWKNRLENWLWSGSIVGDEEFPNILVVFILWLVIQTLVRIVKLLY